MWLHASPDAVRLTDTVIHAAADVFAAHSDIANRGLRGAIRTLQLQHTGVLPGQPEEITQTTQQLAAANKALAEYARHKYGVDYGDLFEASTTADA